ncbi:MAG: PhoU family transcriptional regulator [Arcobacter sp.]|nr:MAG: PhoU family transcriptional regulator [Arcobacter sp.]
MLANYEEKLDEIKTEIISISQRLLKANELVVEGLIDCDEKCFIDAKSKIKNVSAIVKEIDNKIITTLALHSPEARDLRTMVSYLKITNEILRASSNTRNFIKGFIEECKNADKNIIKEYAIPMQKSTVEAIKYTMAMLCIDCVDEIQEYFNKIVIAENKTDDLYEMIEAELLKQKPKEGEFHQFHKMLLVLRRSEKIADRAMSIASLLLYANNGGEIHRV